MFCARSGAATSWRILRFDFSIGRFTTEEEIDYLIDLLRKKIGKLRELSPLWEMHKEGVDLDSVEWSAH